MFSRDRNREHAKNTRLRKKAYVTKLKELVDQLSLQKTMEVKDRVSLGKRIYDTVRLFISLILYLLICLLICLLFNIFCVYFYF